jgi:hypothetical protein
MIFRKGFSLFLATVAFTLTSAVCALAQQPPVIKTIRPSQKASVMQTIGVTDVTITYSRPGVKGRAIFGAAPASMEERANGEATLDNQNERKPGEPVVPYNHVWRAGANEATLFQVTDDVLINGQPLKAGLYSLHTIPGKDEWTIIFNSDPGQWGSFAYESKKDTLRVKTRPQWMPKSQEWLMYTIDAVTDTSAQINIRWEKIRVPFTVQSATNERQTILQRAGLSQTIGVSDVVINYSRKANDLNNGAELSVSDDVLIDGQQLQAGTYNLRVVSGNDQSTVALYRAGSQTSSLQLSLKPLQLESSATRPQFLIPNVSSNSAEVQLHTDRASVSFRVEVPNVNALWRAKADALIAAHPTNEMLPRQVALFYLNEKNYSEAMRFIEQSIRIKETFQNLSSKANILWAAGRKEDALAIGDAAIAKGKGDKANTAAFEKRVAEMRSSPARPPANIAYSSATPMPTPYSRPPANIALTNATPAPTPDVASAVRILTRDKPAGPPVEMPVPDGRYYALVIGNDRYQYVPGLKMAEADARAVASTLSKKFGFTTQLLLNAKRQEIITAINSYRRNLDIGDSLLVYYAGHGYYDREIDRAYWLPVDASKDDNANWISADDITGNIRGVSAKHVLIVSDSCYSGAISRELNLGGAEMSVRTRFLQKMMAGKSRNLMSSGGNEPVMDGGGSGHSVFARAFLIGLEELDKNAFTATELFRDFIQERVAGGARQTPEYSPLRNSGHESGDFVFFRKQ